MTMGVISLAALKQSRTGMTEPENWRHTEDDRRSVEIIGQDFGMHMDNSCDARGVVATVHAANVLVEIAEAALEWMKCPTGGERALVEALRKVAP